mmetsp:Transcript_15283/g.28760  ORF Transcript_15283/g.28760 Transcript_15283/m.28760 type:complete len:278 (+) Transcript_15283:74-907(+)
MTQSSEIENLTDISSNVMKQESSSDEKNTTATRIPFNIGDVVDVQSRTWPGINKPGGTARVKAFNVESQSYNVTYMLGGKEDGVDAQYVTAHSDEPVARERRQTEITNVQAPIVVTKLKRKPLATVPCKSDGKTVKKIKKPRKPKRKTDPTTTTDRGNTTLSSDVVTTDSDHDELFRDASEYSEEEEEYEEEEECEEETQLPELSSGAETAMNLLHTAFEQCPHSGDEYLAVDIEIFILSQGGCTEEDIAACFAKAEEENKIMVALDDEGNRSVYKV